MKIDECAREPHIFNAVSNGTWPAAVDAELRQHVDDCPSCSDLVMVSAAILDDRHASESEVTVAPSGATWWRIEMRMQADARATAARTVQRVQGGIVAATLVLVVSALAATSILGKLWNWAAAVVTDASFSVSVNSIASALPPLSIVALMLAPILLMGPVAVYLAFARE